MTTKIVAVTGASSGIGEATARRLAADGHRLFLGARRTDRLDALVTDITDTGGIAAAQRLDVTDAADVTDFVSTACQRYGRLDVLVSNAGVMSLSPLDALQVSEWDRMIDVNVRGVLHGIAAALPIMRQQGAGQFVHVASTAADDPAPTAVVYCAAKSAVRALSEGLRKESPGDIRVTVVSPGAVHTELADSIDDPRIREHMKTHQSIALPAAAIADTIATAIARPADVDTNEIVVRPAASA